MTALTTAHIMELDTDPREHAALVLNEKTGEIEVISTAYDNSRSVYRADDGRTMYGDTTRYDEHTYQAIEDPDALVVLLDHEGIQSQIDSDMCDENGRVTLEGAAILVDIVADFHHLEREVSYALQTGDDETGWQTAATGTGASADHLSDYALAVLDTQWGELRVGLDSDEQADEMIGSWRVLAVTGPEERVHEHQPMQSALVGGSNYRARVTVRAIRDLQREESRLAGQRRAMVHRLVEVAGSQVAAAAHLGVSQPTISEMIKRIR